MKQLIKKLVVSVSAILMVTACAVQDDGATSSTMTLMGNSQSASASSLTANASSLKLKIYEAWVSQNGDCTNPVKIYDGGTSPSYQEFVGGITIGQGSITNATYNCMIMIMSDNIKFTPAANDGAQCVAGTEYTRDVCSSNGSTSFELPDGTTGTCDNTDQKVAVFLSTYASSTTGGSSNAFMAPDAASDTAKGLNLGSALTVSGNTSNTFVVDVANKIDGSGSDCEMMPPNFSFE